MIKTAPARRTLLTALAIVALPLLPGCATSPETPTETPMPADVRVLPIVNGHDGTRMSWPDLMAMIDQADVVILGEQHNDAVGHAVQTAVMTDVVSRWPGAVLSMEMLERDEQPIVDDYFEGIIDAEQLAKLTLSENWGGKGKWPDFYQPTIDAAKVNGRVVAANAPRRYVRLARTDGYERIDTLSAPRSDWVDRPDTLPQGPYRDRFWEIMSQVHAEETDDSKIEASFRSQLVWDTTMAASMARALREGAPKVVHLVGQFHSDFEGGTVQQLRQMAPHARIVVVSLRPSASETLLDDDNGRADVIVYTG